MILISLKILEFSNNFLHHSIISIFYVTINHVTPEILKVFQLTAITLFLLLTPQFFLTYGIFNIGC